MLRLPPYLTNGRLDFFLGRLETLVRDARPGPILIDFEDLEFVDPAGAVTLANAIDYMRSLRFQPTAKQPLPNTRAVSYLRDTRFFDLLANPGTSDLDPGRSTTFPLTRVAHTRARDILGNAFSPWLARRLSITDTSLEQLRMCLAELFNNISDHADVPTGFFFAQHFPNDKRVGISLADFGVGIPRRVRTVLPLLDDGGALAKAFEEGFSTKTTPRNRGAGLDWLKRYAVEVNGGVVWVASHKGRLIASPHTKGASFEQSLGSGFFPGVLYLISLRTDTIEAVEETRGEIEW